MNASEALLESRGRSHPGRRQHVPRRSEPRLCFRRGAGAYLEDLDGRRYLDYHAAYGAIFLGHSHPAVTERVSARDRGDRAVRRRRHRGRGGLAAKIARARAVGRADGRLQQRLGGHLPRHPPGPRRHRPPEADQVPRLLRRLPRLRAPQCAESRRSASARATRTPPACSRRRSTRRSSAATTTSRTSARRSSATPRTWPRSSSSPSRTTRRGCSRAPASSKACASSATPLARCLIFDEVITGFRHGLGGYQALAGVHARPDDAGQGDRQRLPARGDRRPARAHGALEHDRRRRRALRRHLQRQRRRGRGGPGHDRAARGRPRPRARLRAR